MAGRNQTPMSGIKLRPNHERGDDSTPLHPHRSLTPSEIHIIEDRIAAQSREIQTLLHGNQRLAATHVALKQDFAAAQQDLRRLSSAAPSVKAKRDAQVREVYERSLKLEAEARRVNGLSVELDRVRGEIKELKDERKELSGKLKDIEDELWSTQPELQEFSDLKAEIEAWQRELRKGRAAIEYERKISSNNFELSEVMEKHIISMAREAEKLRAELANAEPRVTTAVIGAAAANQGAGYAIQQPGYAVQQPGYGGNSLSDPQAVHPGYAIQQPGYAIQQPGYGGNPLSGPHVAQPVYGGNTLSNPHVVHQGEHVNKKAKVEGEHSNKKGKVENKNSNKKGEAGTKPQGKRAKCPECKKKHRGECLKGKKVCYRCKKPGHASYNCPDFKEKEPEEKGKAGAIAFTQKEA